MKIIKKIIRAESNCLPLRVCVCVCMENEMKNFFWWEKWNNNFIIAKAFICSIMNELNMSEHTNFCLQTEQKKIFRERKKNFFCPLALFSKRLRRRVIFKGQQFKVHFERNCWKFSQASSWKPSKYKREYCWKSSSLNGIKRESKWKIDFHFSSFSRSSSPLTSFSNN